MQQVKFRKSVGIAACPLNKTRMFGFVQTQARMPLYSFFINFNRHRYYKRTESGKRLKKIRKPAKTVQKLQLQNNRTGKSFKDIVLVMQIW
jgi:hypothetical protein